MSGWIKLEKDLREDPRLLRIVDALIQRQSHTVTSVTQARYISNAAVTQVLGSLAQLWMYADSHIREGDTLDIGADEVNQLVGVEGFAQLLPTDWLQIIDAHSVKLPGFHAHNGTEAKKKALTQKRVQRHRIREAVTVPDPAKRTSVTAALPDQTKTRLDQDHIKSAIDDVPRGTFDGWTFIDQRMRPKYPRGTYRHTHWITAARVAERLVTDERVDPDEIVAGAERYLAQTQTLGNEGTQFVVNPERFLSEKRFTEPFTLPTPAIAVDPKKLAAQVTEAREWTDLKARGSKCGFRQPADGESMGAYRTLLQRFEYDNPVRATA